MEIIHLILGKANPERMNGVNRVVHEMATNQVRLGYNVQVWGITQSPVHDYPARKFTTVLFQSYKKPFKVDRSLKNQLLDIKGHAVIHMHGAFQPCFYSIALFLHRHSIPFIITPHSTYNEFMMKKNRVMKWLYFRLFERRLLNLASCVHLLGQTEWLGLGRIYNNDKSVLLPYGFTPQPYTSNPVKRPLFTVAYCGRLAAWPKGLDILIKGFALFHKQQPHSRLMIIGDGKDRDYLKKMSGQLGLAGDIDFKGSLYGAEKTTLLQQCHVFAHPSRTDGLPATILEAAALGLPCVVSEATNTGDYISQYDAGYVMDELSETRFAAGFKEQYYRIVQGGEQEKLEGNARQMMEEIFNWKPLLRRFETIYLVALAGRYTRVKETASSLFNQQIL